MNGQLVFVEDGTLFLDTSLAADAFAKSRFSERMHEAGYLARYADGRWLFEPWFFTGSTERPRGNGLSVLLHGAAFAGRTLKNYLDQDFSKKLNAPEKAAVMQACALVCTVLSAALEQHVSLPAVGGGGMLIAGDYGRVLFLPAELFGGAVACAGDEASSEYSGMYVHPQLKGSAAVHFTQSVIAYRALTGIFPFGQEDTQRRLEDYRDRNFVPLSGMVWALDGELSFFVDNALRRSPQLARHGASGTGGGRTLGERLARGITEGDGGSAGKAARRPAPGAMELRFPLAALYRELGLSAEGRLPPTGMLQPVIRKSAVSQEQFEAAAAKKRRSFGRRLAAKRWVRRHRTVLAIAAGAVLVAGMLALAYRSGRAGSTTTRGLTSFQTVELFYSAVNNLDVSALQSCIRGGAMGDYAEAVQNVYVASRSRAAYEPREQTVPPASWMNSNYDGNFNMFGLTQFSIGSTKASLFATGPVVRDRPAALLEEGGAALREGQTTHVQVSYLLVYNDSEEFLTVIEHTDDVTLLYHRGRWVVSALEQGEGARRTVDMGRFVADYKATFLGRDKNVLVTANRLREAYPWIPTNSEILEAQGRLREEQSAF